MPQPEPARPDEPKRLGRVSQNAAFSMLMARLVLLATRVAGSQAQAVPEPTYRECVEDVRTDRIDEVVCRERVIQGEFQQPVRRENQDFVRSHTRLAFDPSQGLLDELSSRGVVISAEAAQRGVGALLISLLP